MDTFEFKYPEIREMVEQNHCPTEEWTYGGKMTVRCEQCYQGWPCETLRALWRYRSQHNLK